MLRNGLEEVQSIGDAKVGDKTLIDAYAPALQAFSAATANRESFADALDALIVAAEKGRDSTIDLVAKIGRASRLGERSRGVLDPGATSCAIILRTFAEGAKAKLECVGVEEIERGAIMKVALGADSVGKPLLDVIAAHLARRPDLKVTDLSEPGSLRRRGGQGRPCATRRRARARHPLLRHRHWCLHFRKQSAGYSRRPDA